MTAILGWQNDLVASAALLVDGVVVGAVEEERFTRVKQQDGFPRRSVSWLLDHAGLGLADIAEWAYGWFAGTNAAELLPDLARRVASGTDPAGVDVMVRRLTTEHAKDVEIRDAGYCQAHEFGVPAALITAYEHHPTHAWSAHAFSPFDASMVVTFDGRGDRKSSTLSRAGSAGIEELEWRSSIDSLGHVYSQVTHALGYRVNRHEGKITGLAGHGSGAEAKEFLRTLIDYRDGVVTASPGRCFIPTDTEIPDDTRRQMLEYSAEDLAAGVQDLTEEIVCGFVADRAARLGQRNVALAGGLFANVQLNRRIRELPGIDGVFVQPNMGDAGLSLGAVASAWFRRTGSAKVRCDHMYLGPDPGVPSVRPDLRLEAEGTARWVAEALARGMVVGAVQGRAEFGPRALGHRSILADPSDASINDTLNTRLNRTEFMPFAPVLRAEDAPESLRGWSPHDPCSPFMTMAYECSPEFAAKHPAVVHVDGTARPQVVTAESDPWLHQVLGYYGQATSRWALVNTSFNRHEEPIVLTIDEGLAALADRTVDAVVDRANVWTSR